MVLRWSVLEVSDSVSMEKNEVVLLVSSIDAGELEWMAVAVHAFRTV